MNGRGTDAPRRPRLLVVTTTFPRWSGDTEPRFVLDLSNRLAAAFEVTVLAPSVPGAAARETIGSLSVERYRYAPLRKWECLASPGAILPNIRHRPVLALLIPFLLLAQIWSMYRLLRHRRFDAVHCHWLIPQGLCFAVLRLVMRTPPALLTCHGGDAFTLNVWPMNPLKSWIVANASAVAVVSTEIADRIRDLDQSTRKRRLEHIPMGVDLGRFTMRSPVPGEVERRRRTVVLFVGRLVEKKGVHLLLSAMRSAPLASRSDIELIIVGDGPLRGALREQAQHGSLAGRVSFLGSVNHDRLPDCFTSADIFCAPFVIARNGDREGMPTVLLEAAASGLAIIAADVGGVRDMVENGVSGWLIPPSDEEAIAAALLEAADNPPVRAALGRVARQRAEAYSWDRIGERYEAAIHQMLRGSTDHVRTL